MTLSAPPEQTLREPLDRPGDPPSRRVALIAGIFMVVTFISIPALPLYDQVLNHTHFIVGGGGDTRVRLGALFEILTLIAGVGMAVTLYPVLRRQSESLALGYVTVRVVESSLIAVGIVSLLAVVTLRQDLSGAAGTDNASLILNGRSLVAVHDATFLLGPAFCAAIGNGLILGYLMLRSGLVPRRFALFGIVAGSLALVTALLVLFGAYDQISGPSTILTLPRVPYTERGETLGLVESGCGKTTTGRCTLQLLRPTSGNIYYKMPAKERARMVELEALEAETFGRSKPKKANNKRKKVPRPSDPSMRELWELREQYALNRKKDEDLRLKRREMQIIFQDPFSSLNPRFLIKDIIGEPLIVHGVARGNEVVDRVQQLMEKVGLNPDHLYRYPHEFSGGQRQRIGVARALALNPDLIVLDEPTSALDVSVQAQILNMLNDLQRDLNLTYMFISHDLSTIRYMCDWVNVMYSGRSPSPEIRTRYSKILSTHTPRRCCP